MSAEAMNLEGIDKPVVPDRIEVLENAQSIPFNARLAPRRIKLNKTQRQEIARFVIEDFERDWESRSQWRKDRADILERYRMSPIPKDEPFEGCANVRLPTIMIANHATHARMMASVYGNDPAVKVKGVNAVGRENKEHAETLMHWDARVKDGGDFQLLYRTSHSVCLEGGRVIYTYWDRDIRFVQDAIPVYESTTTGEILVDEAGEPLRVEPRQPEIQLPNGDIAKAVQKVVEHERVVYDAPRSIDLDPDDFLLPYDAKNIQYPDSAHCIMRERESFPSIKSKVREDKYYLTREELKKLLSYSSGGGKGDDEQEAEYRSVQDGLDGMTEPSAPRESERMLRTIRWFGRYDLNGDGLEEECIFLVHPETEILLWWAFLDDVYQHGKRPFSYPRFRLQPGRAEGFGLGQILTGIDDAVNALFNIALDWGKINNVPFFFYVPTALEDDVIRIKPGRGIPTPRPQDISWPARPQSIEFAVSLMTVLQNYIERVTLVSDETVGRQSSIAKSRATKGGTLAIIGEGNVGFELTNKLFLDGIGEMYKQRFQLYQQYMPQKLEIALLEDEQWTAREIYRENILGQFNFEIEADAVSGNKLARFDMSLALFQILSQYLVKVHPEGVVSLARKVIKDSGDKDVEKILPKEVVDMVAQARQLQSQLESMKSQVEMMAKVSDAKIKDAKVESQKERDQAEIFKKGVESMKAVDEIINPKRPQ